MKTITIKAETVKCHKCNGAGTLVWASHYANGVCFACNGAGKVHCAEVKKTLSADTVKKADWVMASKPESYAGLSYAKLLKIRNFCHSGNGLNQAYPELLSHWFEVGEPSFQEAQEARHQEWVRTGDHLVGSEHWNQQQRMLAEAA